jgi:PKD repeat protein
MGSPPAVIAQGGGSGHTLVGWNDLGMHCMDADFEVFSILPPYNVIHAQLIDPSGNLVTNPSGITVTYEGVADPGGSINTTSAGKTNFWDWILGLFGVALAPDEGLAGSDMPGPVNSPQPMHFDDAFDWFSAEGIPITPYDDAGDKNYYPLMKLVARDASGQVLATTRIVLPVSDEMSCSSCHGSGSGPAARPNGGWANHPDPELDYRYNVLLLHDDLEGGTARYTAALAAAGYNPSGLYATATADATPVLCAACHGSNALPGTGQPGIPPLTEAVHSRHADVIDPSNGLALDATANRSACYTCHPGSDTRCLRGAMGNAVAASGALAMQCQSCHGGMSRVGEEGRAGWFDQPTCQNCHTGTATTNNGQIRYLSVFDSNGQRRAAVNNTFATDPDTPVAGVSLYRFSTGHGGLQCEACHGSTHAIYPSSHLNDNLQNLDLQGHAGTLSDCASCHGSQPRTVAGGPHGMHPVGQAWLDRHEDAAEDNPGQCRTCHGNDYRGTVLSRALGDRMLDTEFGTKHFWQGFQIGCYNCHNGPDDDDRNRNRAPVVNDVTASTTEHQPVAIPLSASDADGNSLSLRIVSQPANGTVGLVGSTATFHPFAGFSGSDTFTYAAWDGSTNSNLGTGSVAVGGAGGGTCTVACTAAVDSAGEVGSPASFSASIVLTGCAGVASSEWDFGDGGSSSASVTSHAYDAPGSYDWRLTVTADGVSCTRTGSIEIIPAGSQCSLSCSAEVPSRGDAGKKVEFHGASESEGCDGPKTYEWSFGDGSQMLQGKEVEHGYAAPGSYPWRLRVLQDGATCEEAGMIVIGPSSESLRQTSGRRKPS